MRQLRLRVPDQRRRGQFPAAGALGVTKWGMDGWDAILLGTDKIRAMGRKTNKDVTRHGIGVGMVWQGMDVVVEMWGVRD